MKKLLTGIVLFALLTVGAGVTGATDAPVSKGDSFSVTKNYPIVMD
ncbi:hypothetical protein [Salipaludibacillus aurantiacus]|uniref:Uncharacterized protein n=1 Tax=Salipaludibacillus aurantiacus TaxID=1601833 RepID=A0A1H9XAS1_9BACI|nr:hypothetical protein [Salipaludibacillus aurantiacus]SES43149.1 hypothetical protein SAMN05518684_1324 [Salipaludibacillus aurantiacus]